MCLFCKSCGLLSGTTTSALYYFTTSLCSVSNTYFCCSPPLSHVPFLLSFCFSAPLPLCQSLSFLLTYYFSFFLSVSFSLLPSYPLSSVPFPLPLCCSFLIARGHLVCRVCLATLHSYHHVNLSSCNLFYYLLVIGSFRPVVFPVPLFSPRPLSLCSSCPLLVPLSLCSVSSLPLTHFCS